jgi:hypothetical protein
MGQWSKHSKETGSIAQTGNPSYLRGWGQEDHLGPGVWGQPMQHRLCLKKK